MEQNDVCEGSQVAWGVVAVHRKHWGKPLIYLDVCLKGLSLNSLGFWNDWVQGLWMWKCRCSWLGGQKTSWMLISCALVCASGNFVGGQLINGGKWWLLHCVHPDWQPWLRPSLGNTLLLWAEDCGGIPNPGPGCLGASSDPFGVSNKAAKGRGRREAQCQSRPGELGKH